MKEILTPKYSKPIEREYEAWIIQEIEKYFQSLGVKFVIFAVSPKDEPVWPADECLSYNGIIVGLQFKRAKLSEDNKHLSWSLDEPKHQFNTILGRPEIFYCLPTFINRDFRSQALQHCLFWRPTEDSPAHVAWYHNPNQTTTIFNPIKDACRWGLFIENIMNDCVGKKVYDKSQLVWYINTFFEMDRGNYDSNGLYALYIELHNN